MLVFGGVVWERGPMFFGGPWKSHWFDEDDVFFSKRPWGSMTEVTKFELLGGSNKYKFYGNFEGITL